MLKHCGTTLSQTVDVENSTQVIEFIVAGKIHGFPNRALCRLGITNQTEHTIANKTTTTTIKESKQLIRTKSHPGIEEQY